MSKVKNLHSFTIGELLPVEQFDRGKHYVKVINESKQHRSMVYKEGLNVDVKPFNDDPTVSCVEGRICFTTLEFLPSFCNHVTLIAELTIPEDAKLILDPSRSKYGADKINIIKFWDINDFLEYVGYTEISWAADFSRLKSARGLEYLKSIGGRACFDSLETAEGLECLESIGGDAHFDNLTTAEGLENLQSIGSDAYFGDLTTAEGLECLESIGGDAYFGDLTTAEGLDRLESIGGDAYFGDLTTAEGLDRLESIGGDAYFGNLTTAEGLECLESIGGDAYFDCLETAEVAHIKVDGKLFTMEKSDESNG